VNVPDAKQKKSYHIGDHRTELSVSISNKTAQFRTGSFDVTRNLVRHLNQSRAGTHKNTSTKKFTFVYKLPRRGTLLN
jgi:hypothetical protein